MARSGLHIALLGTRGAPARYGGFETAVEEIGARLAQVGHQVTAYCRNPGQTITSHRGISLVNLPTVPITGVETLAHTALSVAHSQMRSADVAIVFNAANAPLIPAIHARGIPVAVNVDGVEWQRAKWGPCAKRYYRWAERFAVRQADALIADARGIQDYYLATHGVAPEFIPYGAPLRNDLATDRLAPLGLAPGGYHLVVARYEPENNLPLILEGFQRSTAQLPLVVVGHAPYVRPDIERALAAAARDPRVKLVGPVWDQDQLDQLYAHACTYIHGHSVGGTNPSLLRAMGASAPSVAFDVKFNREVLGWTGVYFSSAPELDRRIVEAESAPEATRARGRDSQARVALLYNWDDVAYQYEELCERLVARRSAPRTAASTGAPAPRVSGRELVDLTAVGPTPPLEAPEPVSA